MEQEGQRWPPHASFRAPRLPAPEPDADMFDVAVGDDSTRK